MNPLGSRLRGPSSFVALALACLIVGSGQSPARADSTRYEWTSQAIVSIGSRELRAVHTGNVTAPDEPEARRRATVDAERQIRDDYPLGTLKPGSLTVQVTRARGVVEDEVSVRVTIVCRYAESKEEGLRIFTDDFVIISNPREINSFDTVMDVKGPDGDQSYPRKIRSAGRGSFSECFLTTSIWRGRLVDGGDPVALSVSLKTQSEGQSPTDMGEVKIVIRQEDGLLDFDWEPVRNAEYVGDPQPRRGHNARFRLRNGHRVYDLFATAYNPAEFARIKERENKEFVQNLNDRPDSIEVMTGSATAQYRRQGKILSLGTGKTFIISRDEAAAHEFAARTFPNRPDVIFVKNREEAEEALRNAWNESRRTIFKNEDVLDDTVKFSLTPKVGRQVIDEISKMPRRRR